MYVEEGRSGKCLKLIKSGVQSIHLHLYELLARARSNRIDIEVVSLQILTKFINFDLFPTQSHCFRFLAPSIIVSYTFVYKVNVVSYQN